MLIPLGTEQSFPRRAIVTPALLALTVASYLVMAILDGTDPQRAAAIQRTLWIVGGDDFRWWQPFTATLLHGGLLHLAGNMLFLWVFGTSVEGRYGRLGFLGLYLVSALISGVLHAVFERQVIGGVSIPVPAVGASGAIAGITGSFLVLFPLTNIRCFTFLGFGIIAIPAWWFVGFAVLWDLMSQGSGRNSGVAHLAHLGGYATGFGLSMALLAFKVFQRQPYDLFTIFRQSQRRRRFREADQLAKRDRERALERARQPDPQRDAIAQARLEVSRAASGGDMPAAAAAYLTMMRTYGVESRGTTLSRQLQYDLANHMFQSGDHTNAAVAYERFLEAYPSDHETPSVRLMLGVLYARYLNDPIAAKDLLIKAKPGLDETNAQLADELLQEIA